MKFLSVRDLRAGSARVWRELPEEKEMVVTSNGRPVAILTAVDEGGVEEMLKAWRRVRAAQAMADVQQQSVRSGHAQLTPDDIQSEITSVRQARRNPKK